MSLESIKNIVIMATSSFKFKIYLFIQIKLNYFLYTSYFKNSYLFSKI